ncbi:MAG: sigma-E factor negative regulatory protein [Xanthomonadaceae bacterium]|nr:sigma-E factor negative regulatory protein [Xanthomonadaceae bacterium]MDP2185348.1 sigma-E factor negative regulatory protein [Xanthomonadales bacterium]MDZ4117248.1 sigma-E factor negative regulatory protein [Xanthomonadaceae bacterium]MDZ4376659.1 sigma-E factor negative regulatory protein [Xanthomonadaceae bacterium]
MTKYDKPTAFESLSSLFDGELAADESKFLLRRVSSDRELAEAWSRWSLASVAIKRQTTLPMAADFADRVANAIADEPVHKRGANTGARPMLRWVGGLAVAASAALVALLVMTPGPMGSGQDGSRSPSDAGQVAASGLRESDLRPQFAAPADTVAATATGAVLQFGAELDGLSPELQDYMIRHNAMLNEAGIGGFVPYVDVIAHPKAGALSVALPESAPQ